MVLRYGDLWETYIYHSDDQIVHGSWLKSSPRSWNFLSDMNNRSIFCHNIGSLQFLKLHRIIKVLFEETLVCSPLCGTNKTFPFLILWLGCVFWFDTSQETNPASGNIVIPLFLPSFWQFWTQIKHWDALIDSMMICSISPTLEMWLLSFDCFLACPEMWYYILRDNIPLQFSWSLNRNE